MREELISIHKQQRLNKFNKTHQEFLDKLEPKKLGISKVMLKHTTMANTTKDELTKYKMT